MGNLSDTTRYRRNDEFVARKIAGETVLVPIRQRLSDLESIYTLNEVATFIWDRLAIERSTAEIAADIEQEFSGEPAALRRDLQEFLQQLLSLGAIRRIDAPPAEHDSKPQL